MFLNCVLILPFLKVTDFKFDAIAMSPLMGVWWLIANSLPATPSNTPYMITVAMIFANLRVLSNTFELVHLCTANVVTRYGTRISPRRLPLPSCH